MAGRPPPHSAGQTCQTGLVSTPPPPFWGVCPPPPAATAGGRIWFPHSNPRQNNRDATPSPLRSWPVERATRKVSLCLTGGLSGSLPASLHHCHCGLKWPARPLSDGHLPAPAEEPPAVSTKAGSGSGCPRPGWETSRSSVPPAPQGPKQPLSSTPHWSLVGPPQLAQR